MITVSQALIRASYIFTELNETNQLEWCNKEMNGYEDRENVPDYRIFQGVLTTDISNGFTYAQNIKIPLNDDDENLKKISTIHNGRPIGAIESLADSSNSTFVTYVPADNYWVAQKYIQGDLQNLRIIVHKSAFENLLSSVKTKLIDSLYDLSKKYGNLNKYDMGKKRMKKKQTNVTNNVTFGDNTKISNSQVGNSNTKTEENSKNFFEKHPVLSSIVAALIVGIIVATKYWKEIINFFEK